MKSINLFLLAFVCFKLQADCYAALKEASADNRGLMIVNICSFHPGKGFCYKLEKPSLSTIQLNLKIL